MKNLDTMNTEYEGTNVRQFLAQRGAIVIKETKNTGRLQGLYNDSLVISTMVIALVKGEIKNMSYGVKLERADQDDDIRSSVFLDYDELDELIAGFDFIRTTANDLKLHRRDYTEVTYSTKDNAQFGFFQDIQQQQQAFIVLEPHGEMVFTTVDNLKKIKELLLNSKSHLESRGAR